MTHPVEAGARAAARRLTTQRRPALVTDVEAALHGRRATDLPDQYCDPISLGALIVSIASLAWTIYNDRKEDNPAPRRDVITRRIRVQLDQPDVQHVALSPAEQNRVIDVTVEETLNSTQPERRRG
ncbi:hypothetical protein ACFV4T_09145 [Streptomyces sp. NPDC059755]|uniref:hypothetical protein n=1 Tax=Streptomyces sp. NPDC059755 TaxID=3346934 RepID=UPI00365EC531